jgi:hypothetical protein
MLPLQPRRLQHLQQMPRLQTLQQPSSRVVFVARVAAILVRS